MTYPMKYLIAHLMLGASLFASLFFAHQYEAFLLHVGAGLMTALLLFWHLLTARKWLQHAGHAIRGQRAGEHTKRTYILAIFTFKVWFVAILSGVLLALTEAGVVNPIEGLATAHGYTAITGTVLLLACAISYGIGQRGHQQPR